MYDFWEPDEPPQIGIEIRIGDRVIVADEVPDESKLTWWLNDNIMAALRTYIADGVFHIHEGKVTFEAGPDGREYKVTVRPDRGDGVYRGDGTYEPYGGEES